MRKGCLVPLGFVGGAMVGYVAAFVAYLIYTEALGNFDREGAMAMGVAFFFGPVAAVITGGVVALWLARRP